MKEIVFKRPYQSFAKKLFVVVGWLVGLILFMGIFFYGYFSWQIRQSFFGASHTQIFIVEKGDAIKKIAHNLEKQSLIADDFLFIFNLFIHRLSLDLPQAGRYLVKPGMSVEEIASMMGDGDVFRDIVVVTIPEGFNIKEIEARLIILGLLQNETKSIHDLIIANFSNAYSFLKDAPQNSTLEGYLFPDTYYFERDVRLDEIIRRMLDNFEKKFQDALRSVASLQNKNIFDIVTLAAMIQNEVITSKDMKIVSGLLQKRMKIGMPLQVDATIVYVTGKRKLSYDDLKIDSLYNTYIYKGLPKGPIGNPGLKAINAAHFPLESEYLFYLSKPNGETVFSKTLTEHNIAKRKYLK